MMPALKKQKVDPGNNQGLELAFVDEMAMLKSDTSGNESGVEETDQYKLVLGPLSYKPDIDPIVFQLPRLGEPDTRLKIFGLVFHVHSSKLKEASAFLSQVVDGSDKKDKISSTGFKYNLITIQERDDKKPASKLQASRKRRLNKRQKLDPQVQKQAFKNLMCSFYGLPYELGNLEDLNTLVNFAEYYHALPAVSRSITGPFVTSPKLMEGLREEPWKILPLAARLHHGVLFKECVMVIIMFYREEPAMHSIAEVEDETLREIVEEAYQNLCNRVEKFVPQYVKFILERDQDVQECNPRMALIKAKEEIYEDGDFPAQLRKVLDLHILPDFKASIEELLVNDSKWAYPGEEVGLMGGHDLMDGLLLTSMTDDDLPWDVNAIDW